MEMTGHRSPQVRNSTRLRPDFGRIAEAVSRPGIDPRAWVSLARIDVETEQDKDVLVWDYELGWLVDVTFVGGPLDGEGPVNCRIGSPGQDSGVMVARPPRPGTLVVVLIPNGNANDDAVIICQLSDIDIGIPSSCNGDTIVERDATDGQVSAIDTHLYVAPNEDFDAEFKKVRITSKEEMTLGVSDADQPFVRGTDQADALDAIFDAIDSFFQSIATATAAPPNGALTVLDVAAAYVEFISPIAEWRNARQTFLSEKINGT